MTSRPALDADAAAVLATLAAAKAPPLTAATPEQARAAHVASAKMLSGSGEPVHRVRDETVDAVPVRIYEPADAVGTTLYLHGGGWVVGTLDTYDVLCRALANRSGGAVVSVGYSLAPEARHPHQVLQSLAVLRWAAARPGPLAVAGDSAGGLLAALVTQLARRDRIKVTAQALIYPAVDPALDTPSARENATGYYLETEGMRWYWQHYLPAGPSLDVPVTPTANPDLPPTLVLTAGYDPLRDDGVRFAEQLREAGVQVEQIAFPSQIHGFVRMTGVIADAKSAIDQIGTFLRGHLAP